MSDELDLDVCSPSSSSSSSPEGAPGDHQVILVPPDLARVLIGSNGDRIKRIANETKTIIKVWRDEACRRQSDPMKVLIIGQHRNRKAAAKEVDDLIHGIDANLEKLVENLALGKEIRTNGCTGWEQAVRIPGCLVKSLIGPNGQHIRELAGFSNATLKVERHKDGRARVMISGTSAAKLDAKKKILQFIERYEQRQAFVERAKQRVAVEKANVRLKEVATAKAVPSTSRDDPDIGWETTQGHIEEMKRALVNGGAVSSVPTRARSKAALLASKLAERSSHSFAKEESVPKARPLYPPTVGYRTSPPPVHSEQVEDDDARATEDGAPRKAPPRPPHRCRGAQSKYAPLAPRPPPAPMRAPPPPPARPPPPPPSRKPPPLPPTARPAPPPPVAVPEPEPSLVHSSVPELPSVTELAQLENLYDDEDSEWEEIEGLEEVDEWVPEGENGVEWEPKVTHFLPGDDDEYDPFNTLPQSDEDSDIDTALAPWDILSDNEPVVLGTAVDDINMVNTADVDYACTPCFPDFTCPPSPRSRERPGRKPREPSATPQCIAAAIAASLQGGFGPFSAVDEPTSKRQRT